MFHKKLLALIGGAMALTILSAQPVLAQDPGNDETSDRASGNVRGDRVLPGRMSDGARERRDRRNRDQEQAEAPPAATPEENKAAAQAVLTAAGVSCQVAEATLLGVTAEQHSTYEAVCAEGPGYLAVSSTPPQTFNCLELAGQAETSRLRDPEADVGQQCTLPVNLNPVPVLSAYARSAGIDCTVDQGAAIGKSTAGNLIYEIGCADRDGYWIENTEGAWRATPCWDLALEQESCRYSTAAETSGAWRTVLAGTDAAACDVQQARRVGRDAQGLTVYEVKCGEGGGYFARVGTDFKAQRVHNCIEAATIAGGCTLTAAAPATSEQ
ncbi:MAG: hypothetical protein QME55_04740 [Brevundimonas sp.]|uniref:hypothetical protein n=1 Tax=Brevundimonas sp. TaxID=1871086 RepID=UPI002610E75B|nr:hypothetical protein [Brevundimonas sp.]MDI6624017.1 hypothetical protein [Brevundimonas sp.]MDQ7812817.1 hypothetical protein [Brevundimonas sp.]